MQELRTWLPASVTLVHLPHSESAQARPMQSYLLRSQPGAACVSTMEAVARFGCCPTRPSHLPKINFGALLSGMPCMRDMSLHVIVMHCFLSQGAGYSGG